MSYPTEPMNPLDTVDMFGGHLVATFGGFKLFAHRTSKSVFRVTDDAMTRYALVTRNGIFHLDGAPIYLTYSFDPALTSKPPPVEVPDEVQKHFAATLNLLDP